MNNNPYIRGYVPNYQNNYAQQSMYEQIDNQIAQLNAMKEQLKSNNQNQQQHQPSINQTFQLAPNGNGGIKYVNSIDDVTKETVFVDTPFFSKDMSVVWIKNNNNEIKSYELNEIIPKDNKDLQIEYLQAQIEELKKGMKAHESNDVIDEPIAEPVESKKSTNVTNVSKSSKKSKQSE